MMMMMMMWEARASRSLALFEMDYFIYRGKGGGSEEKKKKKKKKRSVGTFDSCLDIYVVIS